MAISAKDDFHENRDWNCSDSQRAVDGRCAGSGCRTLYTRSGRQRPEGRALQLDVEHGYAEGPR